MLYPRNMGAEAITPFFGDLVFTFSGSLGSFAFLAEGFCFTVHSMQGRAMIHDYYKGKSKLHNWKYADESIYIYQLM